MCSSNKLKPSCFQGLFYTTVHNGIQHIISKINWCCCKKYLGLPTYLYHRIFSLPKIHEHSERAKESFPAISMVTPDGNEIEIEAVEGLSSRCWEDGETDKGINLVG